MGALTVFGYSGTGYTRRVGELFELVHVLPLARRPP